MVKNRRKPKRRQAPKEWTAGWEKEFRNAFDTLFQPAIARLDTALDGRLTSDRYYAIVAILHDLTLGHAQTLTGTRKPPRSAPSVR